MNILNSDGNVKVTQKEFDMTKRLTKSAIFGYSTFI